MNENRRKEIEGIIERLEAERKNIVQIRVADALSNSETRYHTFPALEGIVRAIDHLKKEIG